jgi:hypothetical protein
MSRKLRTDSRSGHEYSSEPWPKYGRSKFYQFLAGRQKDRRGQYAFAESHFSTFVQRDSGPERRRIPGADIFARKLGNSRRQCSVLSATRPGLNSFAFCVLSVRGRAITQTQNSKPKTQNYCRALFPFAALAGLFHDRYVFLGRHHRARTRKFYRGHENRDREPGIGTRLVFKKGGSGRKHESRGPG